MKSKKNKKFGGSFSTNEESYEDWEIRLKSIGSALSEALRTQRTHPDTDRLNKLREAFKKCKEEQPKKKQEARKLKEQGEASQKEDEQGEFFTPTNSPSSPAAKGKYEILQIADQDVFTNEIPKKIYFFDDDRVSNFIYSTPDILHRPIESILAEKNTVESFKELLRNKTNKTNKTEEHQEYSQELYLFADFIGKYLVGELKNRYDPSVVDIKIKALCLAKKARGEPLCDINEIYGVLKQVFDKHGMDFDTVLSNQKAFLSGENEEVKTYIINRGNNLLTPQPIRNNPYLDNTLDNLDKECYYPESGINMEHLQELEQDINNDTVSALVFDWDRTICLSEGGLLSITDFLNNIRPSKLFYDIDAYINYINAVVYKGQPEFPNTTLLAEYYLHSKLEPGRIEKMKTVLTMAQEKEIPIIILTNNPMPSRDKGLLIRDIMRLGLGLRTTHSDRFYVEKAGTNGPVSKPMYIMQYLLPKVQRLNETGEWEYELVGPDIPQEYTGVRKMKGGKYKRTRKNLKLKKNVKSTKTVRNIKFKRI